MLAPSPHHPFAESLECRRLLSVSPLDQTFGSAGTVSGYGGPMMVEPDGKILVDLDGSGTMRRLNADGALDTTFDATGVLDTWNKQPGTANQSDGKRLVLANGAITRFNADGSVDSSFGSNGQVSSFYAGRKFVSFTPRDVAIQGQKIIVAGDADLSPDQYPHGPSSQLAVERLNPDGSLDRTFGLHYAKITGPPSNLTVGPDGTLYELVNDALARFPANGRDGSLGSIGHFAALGAADRLLFAPAGKLIVAGVSTTYANSFPLTIAKQSASFSMVAFTLTPGGYGDNGQLFDLLPTPGPTGNYFAAIDQQGRVLLNVVSPNGDQIIRIVPNPGPTATVSGHVFNDANGNGVNDPGEPALAGVRIFYDVFSDNHRDPGDPATITDSKGNYTLRVSADEVSDVGGKDSISQVVPSGWIRTFPAGGFPDSEPQVLLSSQATISGVDFGDAPRRRFATISGDFSAGKDRVNAWDVQLTDSSGTIVSDVTTGNDGRFQIGQIVPGNYVLRDQLQAGWKQVAPTPSPVSAVDGYASLPITLKAGQHFHVSFDQQRISVGAIAGTIFNDKNGDGVQQAWEGTITDSDVAIDIESIDQNPNPPYQETYIHGDGRWGIDGLPPGKYNISAYTLSKLVRYHATYPRNIDHSYTITVRAGQVIRNSNFGFQQVG